MMQKKCRVWRVMRWLLLIVIAAMTVAISIRFAPNLHEPVYKNQKLGRWLRGHPRDYGPAVEAVGTNAIPYLLAELQITDPPWLKWAERQLGDFGTPWEPARDRRYHAQIGLQVLDTNALPALLEAVFARPIHLEERDAGSEAAFAMSRFASPASRAAIHQRLADAMRSPDAAARRNACLAIVAGNINLSESPSQLIALMRDPDPAVRAVATLAALYWHQRDATVIPAFIERLTDDNAGVRWDAAYILSECSTNAVQAIPALRAAYAAEPSRSRGAKIDDGYPSREHPSARVREAMRDAIHAIDPKASLPGNSQSD